MSLRCIFLLFNLNFVFSYFNILVFLVFSYSCMAEELPRGSYAVKYVCKGCNIPEENRTRTTSDT